MTSTAEINIQIKTLSDNKLSSISINSSYILGNNNNIIFFLKMYELLNIYLNNSIQIIFNNEIYENLSIKLYCELEKCLLKELTIIISDKFNSNIIRLFLIKASGGYCEYDITENKQYWKYNIITHSNKENYLLCHDNLEYYCKLFINGQINGFNISFSLNYYYKQPVSSSKRFRRIHNLSLLESGSQYINSSIYSEE